jgi:SAM-dependent methyltransferase
MVPSRAQSPTGRALFSCACCGLVSAWPRRVDRSTPPPSRPRDARADARRASAIQRLIQGGRILEVDCGTGQFIAGLDPVRFEVVGLESDADLAAMAERRLRDAGARGTVLPRVESARLSDSRLARGSFDLVAVFGSLSRAASPRALLMDISCLLKDGGHVVLETPSLSSITARLRGARWQPLHDPWSEFFFTPATLEQLGSVTGFSGGTIRMPMPVSWPPLGSLVYIARKAAVPLRRPVFSRLAMRGRDLTPASATD